MKSATNIPCVKMFNLFLCLALALRPATSDGLPKPPSVPVGLDGSQPDPENEIVRVPDAAHSGLEISQERLLADPDAEKSMIHDETKENYKSAIPFINRFCPSSEDLEYFINNDSKENYNSWFSRFNYQDRLTVMRDFEAYSSRKDHMINNDMYGVEYRLNPNLGATSLTPSKSSAKVFIYPSNKFIESSNVELRELIRLYPELAKPKRLYNVYYRLKFIYELGGNYVPLCPYIDLISFCSNVKNLKVKEVLFKNQFRIKSQSSNTWYLDTKRKEEDPFFNYFEIFVGYQSRHSKTFFDLKIESEENGFVMKYDLVKRMKVALTLLRGLEELNKHVYHCDIRPANIGRYYFKKEAPKTLYNIELKDSNQGFKFINFQNVMPANKISL